MIPDTDPGHKYAWHRRLHVMAEWPEAGRHIPGNWPHSFATAAFSWLARRPANVRRMETGLEVTQLVNVSVKKKRSEVTNEWCQTRYIIRCTQISHNHSVDETGPFLD